jgi:polyisoprenoid-binding protein YceI
MYNHQNAECLVFTYKDGLLSKIAHDLKIRVTNFQIEVDEATQSVSASFDASSLRVETAMKDGTENPKALSDGDKQKIAGQIQEDVLQAQKFPVIQFQSRAVVPRPDGGFDLQGELNLHGVTKPMNATTRVENGHQVMELTIHQPDFGITPYRAMMGTLKIQPDVRLRLMV